MSLIVFAVYHTGDEAFCVSKEDGIYADPTDETAFYMCKGEKAAKKFCPTGLKFNPMISSCDVPEDVRFTGNYAEFPDNLHQKETTRWMSLPGNAGLKVLSVGGAEESQKQNDKPVLQPQRPRKIFSINIFNGGQTTAKNAVANETLYQDQRQNSSLNRTATDTTLLDLNAKMPDKSATEGHSHYNLRAASNRAARMNASMLLDEKGQLALNESVENSNGQSQSSNNITSKSNPHSHDHLGTEAESNSKQNILPKSSSASMELPINAGNSENKKSQSFQEAGKAKFLSSHLISPQKVFAINVFNLHPKPPNTEKQSLNANENTKIEGDQKVETAAQYSDAPVTTSKAPVQPYEDQTNDGEVFNTAGSKSDYAHGHQNQHQDLGSKPVQDELFTTNEAHPLPLHFKLKVQMDESGKQPGINCTLFECSESESPKQNDKAKDNGTQSMQAGSVVPGPTGELNRDSQGKKNENEFHITVNTIGSEPLRGFHVIPDQANGVQQVSPQATEVKYTSEPKNNSEVQIQLPGALLLKETRGSLFVPNDANTATKITAANQEKIDVTAQDNANTNNDSKVVQPDVRQNETKTVHLQEVSSNASSITSSKALPGIPLKAFGGPTENNVSNIDAYNDKKLENTQHAPGKEIVTGQMESNNKVDINSHQAIFSTTEVPDKGTRHQFHEKGQMNKQNFVQTQATANSQPQLKIILKSPGKLGAILSSGSQLKRRSEARGHIVQILKSLIDRPLDLGSQKKDVLSKLSSLVGKPVRLGVKMPQSDLESIKDSGSIAQSILEANKEYLDDIAMQGMVFSDGDLDTENMTDIADTIKKGHNYIHQVSEFPQWENQNAASSEFHSQGQGQKEEEYFMSQAQNDEDEGKFSSVFSMFLFAGFKILLLGLLLLLCFCCCVAIVVVFALLSSLLFPSSGFH